MGNSSSKHPGEQSGPSPRPPSNTGDPNLNLDPQASSSSRSRNRTSRADFSLLTGFNPARAPSTQQTTQPEQRRETRAEREARRLERERVAREKERERSMREEHVDGGYLVTMGIYKGREDFNKPIVRQLQIERKLAPFWRPIEEDVDELTDSQLVAVARGLPVPEPDAPLPPDLLAGPQCPVSPNQSTQNLGLTVPGQVPANEPGASAPNSALPSPTSPSRRSRGKAIAEALSHSLRSSRNNSQTDLSLREITLPNDPFVNGRPLELVLYRNSEDCPICFATYPGYLNYTRCCGNLICSECFVQIKRPDPHVPESHGEPGAEITPNEQARETHNMLVSEPAVCPYCTQPEFGVSYEPPPFRRGLVYATNLPVFGSSAMSSQTSLHSSPAPASPTSPTGGRRRGQSLSATAPNVVTTDRIRPDWALKLAAQRTTQARRAAAATALHQAAFIMYNNDRQFTLGGRAPRFMRRGLSGTGSGGGQSPSPGAAPNSSSQTAESATQPASRHYMTENDRLQQFEEVMMAEAIRLSLAAEEERRRKAEREAAKEAKKEAKKREKEERKNTKLQAKSGTLYADGQASSSRSSLSLGVGRRRGNSGTSSLRMEVSSGLQGGESSGAAASSGGTQSGDTSQSADKGKAVERGGLSLPTSLSSIPIPQQTGHHGPSHLRQTSNISSLSSSLVDSPVGSYQNQAGYLERSPDNAFNNRASGVSLADSGAGGPESMFNFTSMASRMGINLDGPPTNAEEETNPAETSQPPDETTQVGDETSASQQTTDASQADEAIENSVVTLQPSQPSHESTEETVADNKANAAPEVRLIPGSPIPTSEDGEFSKGLGHDSPVNQRSGGIA
ncbi:hypothetical protein jhhlp_001653 [Lomentospora prolificans]|uniref:RING-type domain-containing protein n=1 Tax=Lomentospora prolificans TaxID=41688 RepID=A0A2N3NIU8_9PEZI|nr:hypothetical protein jhhlp_001653 [Lomentospora prolificans]